MIEMCKNYVTKLSYNSPRQDLFMKLYWDHLVLISIVLFNFMIIFIS